MKSTTPSRVRTGLLTAVLVGGAIAGATQVVSAATEDSAGNTTFVVDSDDTATDDTATDDSHPGPRGEGPGGRHGAPEELAELLGVDAAELAEQLRSGSTLAEVAEANGVDVSVVVDAMVAQANERIDAAVEDGRLTEDEAAERRAEVEEKVAEKVNEPFKGRPGGRGHHGEQPTDDAADTATDAED